MQVGQNLALAVHRVIGVQPEPQRLYIYKWQWSVHPEVRYSSSQRGWCC